MTRPPFSSFDERRERWPTAAALEYRLPVFPVGRRLAGTFENQHGAVRVVRGHPTARHRDLLDAIMTIAGRVGADSSGQLHVVFDLSPVRDVLGVKTDWKGIRKLLLDLVGTVVSIRRPGEDWPGAWPVLTFVGDAHSMADRAGWQFPAKLKRITFSAGAAALLARETQLFLNKSLAVALLGLRHQISRSVARWILSHSCDQHHSAADLLDWVGAGGGARMRRKYLSQLAADRAGLAALEIALAEGWVHYRRNAGVFISQPSPVPVEPKTAVSEPKTAV